MANFQMLELMPRTEWNQQPKQRGWGRQKEEKKSPEILVEETVKNMIRTEEAADSEGGQRWRSPAELERQVEHVAIDGIDLSVHKPLPYNKDALLELVRYGFDLHKPIALSPDLIYGYLAKGIAVHINKYPEELRDLYVSFSGKKTLKYRNDSLVMGSKKNDWSDMFKNFADQLLRETKGNSVVQNDLRFSTSSRIEEAHRHVLSMESMKSYFEYKCYTMCGISCVILEGQTEDWELLREKITAQLKEINEFCEKNEAAKDATLKWWTPAVEVMLDNFVTTYSLLAARKPVSEGLKLWWRTLYKFNAAMGSGGKATVTGWLNILYPYINDKPEKSRNPWVVHCAPYIRNQEELSRTLTSYLAPPSVNEFGFGREYGADEVELEDYPSCLSSVPYIWDYHGTEHNMNILIGHAMLAETEVEGSVYPKGTLKAFPAWVIYHKDKPAN